MGNRGIIGTACTVEIIDEQGQLMRRLPIFWGPGKVFALVNAPDGSIDLLVSRRPADTQAAVVINNRKEYIPNMLGPDPFSYHDVTVGPLSEEECLQLVLARVGEDDETIRERVVEIFSSTGGNPYLIDQLIECLDPETGALTAVPLNEVIEIPAKLEALLEETADEPRQMSTWDWLS